MGLFDTIGKEGIDDALKSATPLFQLLKNLNENGLCINVNGIPFVTMAPLNDRPVERATKVERSP